MNLKVLNGRSIVFLAKNNRWHDPAWPGLVFFPCLLAYHLSRENRVLWVGGLSRNPVRALNLREVHPNLFAFTPWFTGKRYEYVHLGRLNAFLYAVQVWWRMRQLKMRDPIFWAAQIPCADVLPFLPHGTWIYSVGDVLLGSIDAEFLRLVDAILVLSEVTFQELSTKYPTKTLLYSTGVDADLWIKGGSHCEEPPDLVSIPRPRVGFVGNITGERIDFPLLREVALKNPAVSFVFIGPFEPGIPQRWFPNMPNVYLLGAKPYTTLPMYVQGLDVCLIPYKLNAFNLGANPNKIYEYFALGKPVITTPLPSVMRFRPWLYVAENAQEFHEWLARILGTAEPEQLRQERVEIAREHSPQAVLERIDRFLQNLAPQE